MEADKKRSIFRTIYRCVLFLLVLCGIFFFLISPYSLRTIILPWAVSGAGLELSVEEASYDLFHGQIFRAKGLSLTDKAGNVFSVEELHSHVAFIPLVAGRFKTENTLLKELRLRILSVPEFCKTPRREGTSFSEIGSLTVEKGEVFLYLPDRDPAASIRIERCSFDGFYNNTQNHVRGNGELLFQNRVIPFQGEMQWSGDADLLFRNYTGALSLGNGSGMFLMRDLQELKGKLFFDGELGEKNKQLTWKATGDITGAGPTETLHVKLDGGYSLVEERGHLQCEAQCHFSEEELRKGKYLPGRSVQDEVPFPENLRLTRAVSVIDFDREQVRMECEVAAEMDRLWYRGVEYLPRTSFRGRHDNSYSFRTKQFQMHLLDLALETGGGSLFCTNKGDFIFSLDEAGYHVQANNSTLNVKVLSFPVKLLSIYVPVDIVDGQLDGSYHITADSVQQKLKGGLSFRINGLNIALNGKTLLLPHNVAIAASLESAGLDRIRSVIVREGQFLASGNDGIPFCQADLYGEFHLDDGRLELDGNMQTHPYIFSAVTPDPFLKLLRQSLETHDARDLRNQYRLKVKFDPSQNEQLSFSVATELKNLKFLGPQIAQKTFSVAIDAAARFSTGLIALRIPSVRIDVPDMMSATGEGSMTFPDREGVFSFHLDRLTPTLWNSLARLAESCLNTMKYKSCTGDLEFAVSGKEETFQLKKLLFNMIPHEGGAIRLQLDRAFLCKWQDLPKQEAAMTLTLDMLPLSWWNCLLPLERTTYRFGTGIVNSTSEITAKNFFRDFYILTDILVEDASFFMGNPDGSRKEWRVGDCRFTGNVVFPDHFQTLDLHDLRARVVKNAKQYLEFRTTGKIGLEPEELTDLAFTIDGTGPGALDLLFRTSRASELVTVFDAVGNMTYHGDEHFDENIFLGKLNIRDLEFRKHPSQEQAPEPLHGDVVLDLLLEDELKTLKNSSLTLSLPDNTEIFHVLVNGETGVQNQKKHAVCDVKSRRCDLTYFADVLIERKEKQEDADETVSDDTKTVPADLLLEEEAEAIDFPISTFTAAFENITFTDHLKMAFTGTARSGTGKIKLENFVFNINGSESRASGELDTTAKGGWEYNGDLQIHQFAMDPLLFAMLEFFRKDSGVISKFDGDVESCHLSFKGKGVTEEAVRKNLQVSLNAAFRNIVIPLKDKNTSPLLRILFAPISQIPKLINLIEHEDTRDSLQKHMGGHINMLTQTEDIPFTEGKLEVRGNGMRFDVRRLYFIGPTAQFRVVKGFFDPFRDILAADTITGMGTVTYPLIFRGTLSDPDIDFGASFGQFAAFTMDIAAKLKEYDWTAPAEVMTEEEVKQLQKTKRRILHLF